VGGQLTNIELRNLWFSVHKWIGLLLAILIIPISFSGAALVWHDWLDAQLNPARYAVSGPATLPPARYVEAARAVIGPQERVATLRYPEHGEGPVMVIAIPADPKLVKGPPQRTSVYLDGATAKVLDKTNMNQGAVRLLHALHGSLTVPGVGRQIVGWVGVAMLVSSLSGLWLWWPVTGSVRRGLRWKRRPQLDANLHHQLGFWVCIPLAMLSFTGAWISFPTFFGPLIGEKTPPRNPPTAVLATPALDVNDVALSAGAQPISIAWPTQKSPVWKVGLERGEAEVADATGVVTRKPPRPETFARTMRRWHDGTGMGPIWQIVIFLGGLIPVALAVTGVTMWIATRRWRKGAGRPAGLAAAE
jgi:uncharacterized iron-regulated membrane protein